MNKTHQQILEIVREKGIVRSRDIVAQGFTRVTLTLLVRKGLLVRVDRGLYTLPDRQFSEHCTLAEVSAKHSDGVICLLSALTVHDLTTQLPFEVWLAIPNKSHPPKMTYSLLRIMRFSDKALVEGVETHIIDNTPVQVTCIARTIVDCFRYRNKIGLDVALEALHEAWNERRVSMDDLWRYATLFRVYNVMRPYMESLI